MKITWVTRSFLDYRIPVYEEINRLCNNQLTIIYFSDVVPESCENKLKGILGERAIGLSGEIRLGGKKTENQTFANTGGLRIPIRPGLVRKVRQTDPDIILSDGFFQWTYSALINNALFGTPHIMCYERTLHTERNVSTIRNIARKLASKFIDAICCNGSLTQEYLTEFGFPPEKLYLGNMAADNRGLQEKIANTTLEEISLLKSELKISGTLFLYVGQLIPRKGIMELLKAWHFFGNKYADPTLVLIGDGTQRKEAENFIKEQGIKGVRLMGKVNHFEIAKFYAAADIFIIPTLEDNWSLVVPEAMSCSLPILSSKFNGCWPELVKSENGWIFNPVDQENFNETLENAWLHRSQWKKMGEASLNIVEEFSPQKIGATIFEACKATLNEI